ncbi:hypothetical protein LEP1GSC105_2914 [Leptospira interrogans str. UI 12758]|uniref:Uncharacterized protein n=1 Tax=Leptospira interrogans str. UI 12758 TaxID=1049938 RepID=A0A0E2D3H0_LEPIR|nr:hypothetical protein LEP1GSC105_2914 [Leptospira interrogans str. UI 12758]
MIIRRFISPRATFISISPIFRICGGSSKVGSTYLAKQNRSSLPFSFLNIFESLLVSPKAIVWLSRIASRIPPLVYSGVLIVWRDIYGSSLIRKHRIYPSVYFGLVAGDYSIYLRYRL